MIMLFILVGLGLRIFPTEQDMKIQNKNQLSAQQNMEYNFFGTITKIRDGDTIEVDKTPIRLSGITCDEIGSSLGNKAKSTLIEKAMLKKASCFLTDTMSYDRTIGKCATNELGDIGAFLIKSKLCGRCPRYDPNATYLKLQKLTGTFLGTMPTYCKPKV